MNAPLPYYFPDHAHQILSEDHSERRVGVSAPDEELGEPGERGDVGEASGTVAIPLKSLPRPTWSIPPTCDDVVDVVDQAIPRGWAEARLKASVAPGSRLSARGAGGRRSGG